MAMSPTPSWPVSMRRVGLALAGGFGALLCACATPQADVPRGAINVFFSPSGEPFRGGPHDPYPVDVWFARADANHDGALSEAEFVADAVGFFHKLDLNGDGVVDGAEVSAYEQNTAPEILPRVVGLTARDIPPLPTTNEAERQEQTRARGEQDEPRRLGPSISGAAVFSLLPENEPVASNDADFDGKITLAEAVAAARRRFALLDKNQAGRLARAGLPKTPAERLAARAEAREKAARR
jgi:hypothetical protein